MCRARHILVKYTLLVAWILEKYLYFKIRASASCYVWHKVTSCGFVQWVLGVDIEVLQRVESTFQTDIPLLGRIDVETYMNLTDAGDRVGQGLDGLLEGVHDCATGFGADVLAELK
jgi:hypothetical protein